MSLIYQKKVIQKYFTQSPHDLEKIIIDFLPRFQSETVFLLEGEVGAGKTEFVKRLAKHLQLKEVTSPSFALQNQYESSLGLIVNHIDLYRLQSDDDLESTGFWDLFGEKKSLVIIEWSQMLNKEFLPLHWMKWGLSILKESEKKRTIEVFELVENI